MWSRFSLSKIKFFDCGHFFCTMRISWDMSMSLDKKFILYTGIKRIMQICYFYFNHTYFWIILPLEIPNTFVQIANIDYHWRVPLSQKVPRQMGIPWSTIIVSNDQGEVGRARFNSWAYVDRWPDSLTLKINRTHA